MAGVNRDGGGGTKKKRGRREGAPAIRTGQFALPPPISLYMYIIELRQLSIQLSSTNQKQARAFICMDNFTREFTMFTAQRELANQNLRPPASAEMNKWGSSLYMYSRRPFPFSPTPATQARIG